MPVKSYPFIDIAVHDRVREHFARGDAAILFAPDLSRVLWSNGEGAALFGLGSIYDFLDSGLDGGAGVAGVAFRQLQATARQLREIGETRRFMMRLSSGFRSTTVTAALALIHVRAGERAILFTAPRAAPTRGGLPASVSDTAARMISGFDDPDTHMAVLDGDGAVLAASPQFQALGMTQQTLLSLVEAVGRDSDWLLKRPVLTGKGTLPAAIGKVSADPALHLLFAVETILGHMDATTDFGAPAQAVAVPEAVLVPDTIAEPRETEPPETIAAPTPTATDVEPDTAVADLVEPIAPLHDVDAGNEEATDAILGNEDERIADGSEEEVPGDAVTEMVDDRLPVEEPADATPLAATESDDAEGASIDTADADEQDDEHADEPVEVAETSDALSADGADEGDDVAGLEPAGFVFDPAMRSIRFVWKIGADGRFSEISREFARAVGPQAADVLRQSFADLAARFALDPDRTIVDLLNRRDTWSGKTVLWPVEGEALCVPVDLAALPTYSRNREFDGFRGFGIVRVSDAVADPSARGLNLAALPAIVHPALAGEDAELTSTDETAPVPDEHAEGDARRETLEDDGSFFLATDDATSSAEEANAAASEVDAPDPAEDGLPRDPFMGERPALKLVETPLRRHSDKVVPIDNARPAGSETLTRSEQAAFREIARQLTTTFGKRTEPPAPPVEDGTDAGAPDVGADDSTRLRDETQGEDAPVAAELEIRDAATSGDAVGTEMADDGETSMADEKDDAAPLHEAGAAAEPEPDDTTVADEAIDGDEAAAGSTDDRDVALSPAMIDRMESAVLIHSGDELYHANAAFLALTGYQTLQDLRVEGGIDALFVGEDEGILDVPPGAMMMIRNDGRLVPVTARLQAMRFDDKGVALMMSLAVAETPAETTPDAGEALVEELAVAEPEASTTETVEATALGSSILTNNDAIVAAEARAEALQIETEELRAILETATDGVVVMGAEGDIRSLNRSANALFNYNDADVIGKPFATLFAHESQRAVMDYLAGLAGHGVASVLNDGREVIGREASGGFIPLFMTMGRLSSSNGYCAVIRDITQWKRTEEELRSAKRAAETANAHKTDFLARVSHEIRTPLNAIIGFSDMMASEHFGPIGSARYIEYASDIGRSGRHVLDIVNDLLDISKIEAGEMELDFAAVEINEAVSEAVSLVQPQANAQRVIIRTSLSTSVPSVVADNRSIKQIALNILANAIRFTPAGGQIVVSTAYEANGSVMLRIRDTGVGMTRTELEQAMKPFRQVTTGARKRGEGTGLGLPLTKAMAEANRALFSINSAPNEGTLVEITFPSQRVLAN
ncbi:PAS/PAC sensor signal transduction histidine kinase [Rhizobium sp. PP-F2F-G48]|uniref:PAS domain S-box protein n=1 Tax=Rhizobium sp. PP-F2F-G48 TaxID=2135651 RepID=UPI00104CC16E|nr:PAS domain S-box protein [Rhizobium sp. PP-F2F-G48]TCM55973.1 PAS/PAC sensor signal transduction histidine kinase [Rhizobium sp. PP-F2F-G48]